MPRAKSSMNEIKAKRKTVSPAALRRRADLGTLRGDERALIRVGRRNTRILAGTENLEEWDDEELRRGQRKDKNGKWMGRRPLVVPKAVHDELVKRQMAEAERLLQDNLVAAITVLVEIASSPMAEDKDKLRAINMIMERVMGKTPDKVEFSGDKPWYIALTQGIISHEDDVEA